MKNIEVYTIDNCSYCDAAKSLLKNRELSYQEFNLSGDSKKQGELVQKTGHRTMPQIFIDGQFIGGFTELKKFLSNNS
jgi:glutaredoxin